MNMEKQHIDDKICNWVEAKATTYYEEISYYIGRNWYNTLSINHVVNH